MCMSGASIIGVIIRSDPWLTLGTMLEMIFAVFVEVLLSVGSQRIDPLLVVRFL